MDIVNVICEGTMKAAADIITRKSIKTDLNTLTAALKAEVVAGYDGLIAEMKEANDCNMGGPMLKTIMAAGCTQFAINALKSCGAM